MRPVCVCVCVGKSFWAHHLQRLFERTQFLATIYNVRCVMNAKVNNNTALCTCCVGIQITHTPCITRERASWRSTLFNSTHGNNDVLLAEATCIYTASMLDYNITTWPRAPRSVEIINAQWKEVSYKSLFVSAPELLLLVHQQHQQSSLQGQSKLNKVSARAPWRLGGTDWLCQRDSLFKLRLCQGEFFFVSTLG